MEFEIDDDDVEDSQSEGGDDDTPSAPPLLKGISLTGVCGVDVGGSRAEIVAVGDDNNSVLTSVAIPEGSTSVEFANLNISAAGKYFLKITVGTVFIDPDDMFVKKIEASFQGKVSFKEPTATEP